MADGDYTEDDYTEDDISKEDWDNYDDEIDDCLDFRFVALWLVIVGLVILWFFAG